jgi:alkylhydroperoxidase family enzyme
MPRLRQVPRSEVESKVVLTMYNKLFGDRDPVAEPGTATGTPGDWWTVFALAPDIFKHAVDGFGIYRSPDRTIDPVLRELGQTRAGYLGGSQFVFSQHCKSLRTLGVSDEKIASINAWGISDLYTPEERAILFYTDCLIAGFGRVDDPTFAKMKEFFTDEQIFEFTYIISLYGMHAVITRALRMEYDDRDEPVVEIAAPEDFKGMDLGITLDND